VSPAAALSAWRRAGQIRACRHRVGRGRLVRFGGRRVFAVDLIAPLWRGASDHGLPVAVMVGAIHWNHHAGSRRTSIRAH
jgi:hypothetical protein